MSSSPQVSSPSHSVLSFELAWRQKRRVQPCIFCGHTHSTHRFKGKSVCFGCLKRILSLFP